MYIMRCYPLFTEEAVAALGAKVAEDLRAADPRESV